MNTDENLTIADKPCIVLDGVFFQFLDQSGITRVWTALLEEWSGTPFGQSLLVLDREGAAPKFPGISYIPFKGYRSTDAAGESFILEEFCRQHSAKIFISTFYTTPLETPSVMMVHDMIPERFGNDDQKWCKEKRFSTYHASGYIAVSERTAQDLQEDYPTTRGAPLCIAHNGVSADFRLVSPEVVHAFKLRHGINKPYFLCVGRRTYHKNCELFFRAFSRLPDNRDVSIVCCGQTLELEPELRQCSDGNEVHMLNLSDSELNAAYAGALALVYPSKYEGFGLPIIEAMAAGCPVITCPCASIPEIAGEAALYVGDSDLAGMVGALMDIKKSEIRDPLIQAGLERSKLFTWTKTAGIIESFLTEMAHRNYSMPEAVRPKSRQQWRELRTYERQLEGTSERMNELLRRPELRNHMSQSTEFSVNSQELEAAWLNSIAAEGGISSNDA